MARGSLGFIGFGNMGSAIAGGLATTKMYMPSDMHVYDVDDRKIARARMDGYIAHDSVAALGKAAETVIIAVKPKDVSAVLEQLADAASTGLVISIAAGITASRIEAALGTVPVIRAMPNTPCLIGDGITAVSRGTTAGEDHIELAKSLLGGVGMVIEVPESSMDAVTGLSGSGPAYVALFIEALTDAGVMMGLARDTALTLAIRTVYGSAKMLSDDGMHPSALKEMVTSPGGTTIAGLAELERGCIRGAILNAVEAATLRSEELGR